MKKSHTIIIAIITLALGFYGGTLFSSHSTSGAPTTDQTAQTTQGRGQGRGGRGGPGFTAGQVIAKDSTSVTLKLQNGGSQIVFFDSAVTVRKTVDTTLSAVTIGTNVSVMGTPNSDGSITAQSLQIRPVNANASTPSSQ